MIAGAHLFRPGTIVRPAASAALVALALLAAAPVAAQNVAGVMTDRESGRGIEGAVVVLLDANDAQLTGTLTNAAGEFRLRAPRPGTYRLRAERVGYATIVTRPLEVPAAGVSGYALVSETQAVTLTEAVEVRGRQRCQLNPADAVELQQVWEEARKALNAAALTRHGRWTRFDVEHYRRELEPGTLRVREQTSDTTSGYAANPFRSRPVAQLLEFGFVEEVADSFVFHAPDAEVLLDPSFTESYCFSLEQGQGDEDGLVGLAFRPARQRRLAEVTGTLWLDPYSAELRHLEYRYTSLPWELPLRSFGGRVEFQRLPSGAWIVNQWYIRTPEVHDRFAEAHSVGRLVPGRRPERDRFRAVREQGGRVLAFRTESGTIAMVRGSVVTGMVFDSTRMAPLADATVSLVGTRYSATSDEEGRFRIAGVPPGEYLVALWDPYWGGLGANFPHRELSVRSQGRVEAELGVPPIQSLVGLLCEDAGAGGGAVVTGFVRDARSGEPVPDAAVRVGRGAAVVPAGQSGRVGGETSEAPAAADAVREVAADHLGFYRVCGVPVGEPFWIEARGEGASSGAFTLDFETQDVARYDLPILPH